MEASLVTSVLAEDATADERGADERMSLVVSTAEVAACTCPEACERDHDRD